jgi:hypothetical protein
MEPESFIDVYTDTKGEGKSRPYDGCRSAKSSMHQRSFFSHRGKFPTIPTVFLFPRTEFDTTKKMGKEKKILL